VHAISARCGGERSVLLQPRHYSRGRIPIYANFAVDQRYLGAVTPGYRPRGPNTGEQTLEAPPNH
jgi:hypothetical protein